MAGYLFNNLKIVIFSSSKIDFKNLGRALVEINNIQIGDGKPFVLIAGPCVVENEELIMETANAIKGITTEWGRPYIFNSSYKKADRTS